MLRFFRIIRRSLLELSQVRTYFFYAIGEIALVVIGILIALQVNNWNEERNDSRQINLYLENLAKTLHEEIDNYKRMASLNAYRYNGLQYLLEISGNEKINHDPIPIDTFSSMVLKHLGEEERYNTVHWKNDFPDTYNTEFIIECFRVTMTIGFATLNPSVYEEMKSTGLMSKIGNNDLKKAINEYYTFVYALLDRNGDWNERLTFTWQEFLMDRYNVVLDGRFVIGDPIPLLDDPDVISRIQIMVGPAMFRATNSYRAIELAEKILAEMENGRD